MDFPRATKTKTKPMDKETTDFSVKTDALGEKDRAEAKVLLAKRDEILNALAKKGMHEDSEVPYAYYIPTDLSFECGYGPKTPMRSIYAIVLMARASYATAHLLDTDKEGYPELPEFTERGKEGFHRVFITDPFAIHLDNAIKSHQERMIADGRARIVNGKFYKVAQ